MITGIEDIVRKMMAEGATAEKIVQELYKGGAINDSTARFHVVNCEFFRLLAAGGRTAHDIEQELAIVHDINVSMVRYIRTRYVKQGKHLRRGAKKGN